MTIPKLPSHVTSEIIAYLPYIQESRFTYNPKPLASSCAAALTCRSWLTPARRNIFHTVTIPVHYREAKNGPAELTETLRIIEAMSSHVRVVKWSWTSKDKFINPGAAIPVELYKKLVALSKEYKITHTLDELRILPAHETVPYFLAVLEESPELAECIDTVTWNFEVPHATTTAAQQHWETKGGPELMKRLKSIRNLTLRGGTFGSADIPVLSLTEILPRQSIVSLHIADLKFSTGVELCSFVASFTHIRELKVGRIKIDKAGLVVSEEELRKMDKVPPIKRLEFGTESLNHHAEGGADVLLKWLSVQSKPVPVEKMVIVDARESVALASFCYATLKSLSIICEYLHHFLMFVFQDPEATLRRYQPIA